MGYPENAAEAAALDVIAKFAMVQEEIEVAVETYLDASLSSDVKTVLWKRLRFSDGERLSSLVALAGATQYPLHAQAYRDVFHTTKSVRDRLAHGGLSLSSNHGETHEPGLFTFGKADPDHWWLGLSTLKSTAADAHWLYLVAWRTRALLSDHEEVPERVRQPSDVPRSSVIELPSGVGDAGTPPLCPNGHANVHAVGTQYGHAWLCAHCDHVRLRDESALVGSRATLSE